jgi:type IV secretion system protein VirB2
MRFRTWRHQWSQVWLKANIAVFGFMPFLAHASNTGMPYEAPLEKVVNSITGPVAFGASVLGIVAAGLGLIFGGEMNGFIQKLMILSLVISVIVMATNLMSFLFNVSSTLVI